jgi:phosphatidylinositol-3-phosphatase
VRADQIRRKGEIVTGRLGRRLALGCAMLAVMMVAAGPASARTPSHQAGERGAPQHIFFIMMENHKFSQIIGNTADAPYINQLAKHSAVLENFYGVTHPSLTNYLAAVSGSFQGIWDDCPAGATITCPPEEFVPGSGDATDGNYLTKAQVASASATPHLFKGRNLVDQLQSRGLTWRAYMQQLPKPGSKVVNAPTIQTSSGPVTLPLYAQKHNPFVYFSDIWNNRARLRHIVPFDGFASDLRTGNVPNYVFISPDQCHDMHGVDPTSAALAHEPTCGYPNSGLDHGAIRLGDAFLQKTVGEIMASRTWKTSRSTIVIAWDENDYSGFSGTWTSPRGRDGIILGGGRAPALVVDSWTSSPRVVDVAVNHYNVLGTIQRVWGLGCLANTCRIPSSQLLTSLFR